MNLLRLPYPRMLLLSSVAMATACSAEDELGLDVDCLECGDAVELRSAPIVEGPLFDYVNAPDASYGFSTVAQIPGEGFTAHLIQMTSQEWRTADEVTPNLWTHWVTIVVPDQILTSQAHLIITGGSMSAVPPDGDDLALFGPIALATATPVVILSEVPGQPLTVPDRPDTIREDELVSYSWKRAMETGDPTWAAYLPMTKAAVRAMDTADAFLGTLLGAAPTGFVVTGFSKRGATAWLTAAVDSRVSAVVPGVFNVLHLAQQVDDQFENYGEYAEAASDYEDEEVLQELRSPEGMFLTGIVDPISYVEALTMPHYILQATGDEFFVPDGSRLFVDEIPGEVTQRIVANESHSLENNLEVNLAALVSWYQSVLFGAPRPVVSEQLLPDGTLDVQSDQPPVSAVLWQATVTGARDFRFDTIGAAWTPTPIAPGPDGHYLVDVPEPVDGYTAYMVEFTYPGVADFPQLYTTSVYVTPDDRPFSIEQPIDSPRRKVYWKYQVLASYFGWSADYSGDQLEAMLPIRVRDEYINTIDELFVALFFGGNAVDPGLARCTATRLNIESGKLGWYSRVSPTEFLWSAYQAADQGDVWEAVTTCRDLNRL